jgi:hypothetical protein
MRGRGTAIGLVFACAMVSCDQGDGSADTGTDSAPDTAADTSADTAVDAPEDTAPDVAEDTGTEPESDTPSECGPSWHPTSCHDCSGGGSGGGCYQNCDGSACDDGRTYRAECEGTTCSCLIDGVEVCTCTPSNPPDGPMGCQPEEWGGANCCWNVG